MRSIRVMFMLIATVATIRAAVAQGTGHPPPPPPPCRDRICGDQLVVGGIVPASLQSRTATDAGALVRISDETLHVMGISRAEFVDRISAGFFPGLAVDLLISTTELASTQSSSLERLRPATSDAREPGVSAVALEVRTIYLIPRSRAGSDLFDLTDGLVVTDGQTWVTVRFQDSPAAPGLTLAVR
jgi:hypothetical protein